MDMSDQDLNRLATIVKVLSVPFAGFLGAFFKGGDQDRKHGELKKRQEDFERKFDMITSKHAEVLAAHTVLHQAAKEHMTEFAKDYREDAAERRKNDASVRDCLVRIAAKEGVEGPK